MIKNIYCSLFKVSVFFSGFNETWIFMTDFKKLLKYQISWKSIQWELSFKCSQRDVMKRIATVRNCANRPKMVKTIEKHSTICIIIIIILMHTNICCRKSPSFSGIYPMLSVAVFPYLVVLVFLFFPVWIVHLSDTEMIHVVVGYCDCRNSNAVGFF